VDWVPGFAFLVNLSMGTETSGSIGIGAGAGMQIAVFDYKITRGSPTGICYLAMIQRLCQKHSFTVFAVEFENPCPEKIHWVRIPSRLSPLPLLFLTYHLLAPLYYWAYGFWRRKRFGLIQSTESNVIFGDISYMHFCCRSFLKHYWRDCSINGLRRWVYWLNYRLHALAEPWALRRAKWIVVPSQGLKQRLGNEYPFTAGKIIQIANPADLEYMRRPEDLDPARARWELGLDPDDVVLVFVALGNFEHKGLPLVLEAMARLANPKLKLVVVGGKPDVVAAYRTKASKMKLESCVVLVGTRPDVRPYLWLADALILPSLHETFPLVSLEAAAASIPLIVTRVSGVDEFALDGENAILVDYTSESVAAGIARFFALPVEKRKAMGTQAQWDVRKFGTERFALAWEHFYSKLCATRESHIVETEDVPFLPRS